MNLQIVWELQNFGLGNRALVREQEANRRRACLELLRTQDQVIADVVQSRDQLLLAKQRISDAETGLQNAIELADKSLKGLGQTKRSGDQQVLLLRPQEVLNSVSILDRAYRDHAQAVEITTALSADFTVQWADRAKQSGLINCLPRHHQQSRLPRQCWPRSSVFFERQSGVRSMTAIQVKSQCYLVESCDARPEVGN